MYQNRLCYKNLQPYKTTSITICLCKFLIFFVYFRESRKLSFSFFLEIGLELRKWQPIEKSKVQKMYQKRQRVKTKIRKFTCILVFFKSCKQKLNFLQGQFFFEKFSDKSQFKNIYFLLR
jgi:hypothetical protein